MKVARYYSHGDIRVEEMPVPTIGPGEILVQVEVCGLCGSDLMEWYVAEKAPIVLGHEPAGVVAGVGLGVDQLDVGDRVFVHHHVPCFACHYCQRGYYTLCSSFRTTHLDPGGFAQYVRVPAPNVQKDVLKLPAGMSFDQAALIEPVATCIRGIQRANIQVGDTVVVVGAGVTGLIHVQLARILGAGTIVVTDFAPYRLEMARQLGADHALDADADVLASLMQLNDGRLADAVIVTAGGIQAMEQGMALADGGATVVLFGVAPPEAQLAISPHRLLFSEITLTASYSCSPVETRQALALIHGHRVSAEKFITHRFDLGGVSQAIQIATQAQDSMKIVITP